MQVHVRPCRSDNKLCVTTHHSCTNTPVSQLLCKNDVDAVVVCNVNEVDEDGLYDVCDVDGVDINDVEDVSGVDVNDVDDVQDVGET